MCSNDAASSLNALISAGDNAPVVTVHYGPYMNWGRWNHNTSRIQPLLDALARAGISVQLAHDDAETSWQDHGFVRVALADGTVVADEPQAQHNRGYSSRMTTMETMAATAQRAIKAGMGQAKATAAPVAKLAAATGGAATTTPSGIGLAAQAATDKVVAASAD